METCDCKFYSTVLLTTTNVILFAQSPAMIEIDQRRALLTVLRKRIVGVYSLLMLTLTQLTWGCAVNTLPSAIPGAHRVFCASQETEC